MSEKKYDSFETAVLMLIGARAFDALYCTVIGVGVFAVVSNGYGIVELGLSRDTQVWPAILLTALVGLAWTGVEFVLARRQFLGSKPATGEGARGARSLIYHADFVETRKAEQWSSTLLNTREIGFLVGLGIGIPSVAVASVLILGGVLLAILITLLAVAVLVALVRSDVDAVRPLSWHISYVTIPLIFLPLAVFIAATPFVYDLVSPDISTTFIENTASSPIHLVFSIVALVVVTIVSTHCLLVAYDATRLWRMDDSAVSGSRYETPTGDSSIEAEPSERLTDRSPDETPAFRSMVSGAVGMTPPTLSFVILDTFGLTELTAAAVVISSSIVFGLVVVVSPEVIPVSYTDFDAVVVGLAGASILSVAVVVALLTASIEWADFKLLVPVAVVVGFTSAIPLRALPV